MPQTSSQAFGIDRNAWGRNRARRNFQRLASIAGSTIGTVASVGVSVPSIFSVVNSPVTHTGVIAISLNAEPSTTVLAGPISGAPAAPTFRQLSTSDIAGYSAGGGGSSTTVIGGTGISVSTGGSSTIVSNTGVTSVALSMPSIFTVSGSPVTTTGTLTAALATETSTTVLAGPASGVAAAPTFRQLTTTDISGYAAPSTFYTLGGTGISVSTGGSSTIVSNTGVTSVALSMPSIFTVSGSPVTSTGTLTAALATETSTTVLAGPASGVAAAPTFRQLTTTDISGYAAPSTFYTLGGTGISVSTGGASTIVSNTGVTSVALSMPSIFTVSGSPVTTTGTLTAALATETANTVFAGPSSGSAATPTFRALSAADVEAVVLPVVAGDISSPSAGQAWYNSTLGRAKVQLPDAARPVTHTIFSSATNASVTANTVLQTITAYSYTIPAGMINSAGAGLKLHIFGTFTSSVANTWSLYMSLNGSLFMALFIDALTSGATVDMSITLLCDTAGSSGQLKGVGHYVGVANGIDAFGPFGPNEATFDLTSTVAITFQASATTTTTSDSVTFNSGEYLLIG